MPRGTAWAAALSSTLSWLYGWPIQPPVRCVRALRLLCTLQVRGEAAFGTVLPAPCAVLLGRPCARLCARAARCLRLSR